MHIPYSRAWIIPEDRACVDILLAGGRVSQGAVTRQFEDALCAFVGAGEGGGVAFASGVSALTAALLALEVGPKDEIILPSYICQEVTDAVLSSGARPVFSDTGQHWVVTADDVRPYVHPATRAIIVPHLFGIYADIAPFRAFGIPIIEDCAQAVGQSPDWQIAGDIAVFSFRWSKCLTTGEGGMAVTKDPQLLKWLRAIRDGSDRPGRRIAAPLSDIASALGLSQLSRYPSFLDRRRQIAERYKQSLDAISPSMLADIPFHRSMFYRLPIKVNGGWSSHHEKFLARGISVDPGIPVLQHRFFCLPDNLYPTSIELLDQTIVLPIFPNLTLEELIYCLENVGEILSQLHLQI